jgi:hypothetical protein
MPIAFYDPGILSRKHLPPAEKTRKIPWLNFVFSAFRAFVIDLFGFAASAHPGAG